MSADEIRRLAESCKDRADYYKNMTPCSDLEHDKWYRDAAKTESDKAAALLAYAAMVERCEEIKSKYCLARNRIDQVTSLHPDATYEMILSKIKEFDYILKGAPDDDSPHGS